MPFLFARKTSQTSSIANDGKTATPRHVRIWLSETTERIFWLAAGIMLCILFGVVLTATWVIYHSQVDNDLLAKTQINQAIPAITVTTPTAATVPAATVPPLAKDLPPTDLSANKPANQIAPPPGLASAGKNDLVDGIAISESALNEKTTSDPETVALVAAQLGDRPINGKPAHAHVSDGTEPDIVMVSDDHESDPVPRLDEAQRQLDDGDYAEALASFNAVLAADPANRVARHGKANALQMLGQYDAAIAVDRAALRDNPKDIFAKRHLKHLLAAAPDSAALDPADDGAKSDDTGTAQPITLSDKDLLKELNRSDDTPADLQPGTRQELDRQDSASIDPVTTALMQATLARRALQNDDTAAAIKHFDRAVRLEPDNLGYRLSLAIAYDRAGQRSAALGVYRQVLDITGDMEEPSSLRFSLAGVRARADYLANSLTP